MTTSPDNRQPRHVSGTDEKARLGLRIWAKINGMTPEQYRRHQAAMARFRRQYPRPTSTAELNEASLQLYGKHFVGLLQDGEELRGIPAFELTDNVPRPPADLLYGGGGIPAVGRLYENHKYNDSERYRFKLAGHGGTWMGGNWDSDAGRFALAVGDWPLRPGLIANYLVFTNRRVLLISGLFLVSTKPYKLSPPRLQMEYRPGDISIRPGWPGTAKGYIYRVDLAFPDSSWVGIEGTSLGRCTVGTAENTSCLYRDLIAELLGFPVPPRTS
jgi:hypothetical protein